MTKEKRVVSSNDEIITSENRANEFEFNKSNFNQLVFEVLRLRRQRTECLMELLEAAKESNRQKSLIVDLYSRLNYDVGSPLKMVI